MDTKQHLRFSKHLAVLNVVSTTPLPVPLTATPVFTELVNTLRDGVEAVRQADRDWLAAITDGHVQGAAWRSVRDLLRTQLLRARKVARIVNQLQSGVVDVVTVPHRTARGGLLLTAARSALQTIAPFSAAFTQNGLPEDALSRITQLIGLMEETASSRTMARQRRVTAKAEVTRLLRALSTTAQSLDVLVRAQCETDPVHGPTMLEAWTRALDMLGAPHRASEDKTTPVTPIGTPGSLAPSVELAQVPAPAAAPGPQVGDALPVAA